MLSGFRSGRSGEASTSPERRLEPRDLESRLMAVTGVPARWPLPDPSKVVPLTCTQQTGEPVLGQIGSEAVTAGEYLATVCNSSMGERAEEGRSK